MKWWIDDVAGGGVSRDNARIVIMHAIRNWFVDRVVVETEPEEPKPDPRVPDRATWGMLPEHVAAAARAERMIPGGA